jgi:protein-tyrosine phosphatase
VRVHHVPLFDGERSTGGKLPLDQIYLLLLRVARAPIARAVALLAECGEPALYHCAAGKDRTGLVSAVVLGALGVRDEDVVADYAATRAGLEGIVARLRASDAYQYVFTELPPDTLHAEPATMERVLAEARREHGSMRDYLLAAGVAGDTLARLEDRLLEDA